MEIFKPVVGFEKQYLVSNHGSIYSLHRNRQMIPKKSKTGYLRITLCDKDRRRNTGIHRLVAEAFIENPNNKPTVNHKNENKSDNRVENLEWATIAEQNAYGTRSIRAMLHTDWKKRTEKMDYVVIASKHNYQNPEMCNRKQTAVYKDGIFIGRFESQRKAAKATGVSAGRVCLCINGKIKQCRGFTFKEIDEFPIAVAKIRFPEGGGNDPGIQ